MCAAGGLLDVSSSELVGAKNTLPFCLGLCAVPIGPALKAQGLPAASPESPSRANQANIASPNLDTRSEFLLRNMPLEEKVGLLVRYSAGQATGPGAGRDGLQGHDRARADWGLVERSGSARDQ
jgi:hypothetical protein